MFNKENKSIKRALLMVPPVLSGSSDVNPLPPLGLAYLSSVLKKLGIEVKIYDSILEFWRKPDSSIVGKSYIGPGAEEIKKIISEFKPDIVGVNNLFTCQKETAHLVYKCAKEVDPKIITIAGGAHPTVMPKETLEDKNVDFVVIGEGEKAIVDIIGYLNGEFDCEKFDGVGYRHGGKVIIRAKTKYIDNLDEIPFPDWEVMLAEKYFGIESSHGERHKRKFMPIITSRGCTASCTFCTAHCVWGKKYRKRSVENVIAEMKQLKDKYGIEEIMFEDDNVTLDPVRAKILFKKMIDEKIGFIWDTPNGVAAWTLDEEILDLMKASGCIRLNLAIESGCQEVLDKVIRKPVKLDKIEKIIEKARNIDLPVSSFFVVGMPGETIRQIKETFYFAAKNKIYQPHVSIATPYPGSELYNECESRNLFINGYNCQNLHIHTFNIKSDNWTTDELKWTINWGFGYLYQQRVFNDRSIFVRDIWINRSKPTYILGRILDLINPNFKLLIKMVLKIDRGPLFGT